MSHHLRLVFYFVLLLALCVSGFMYFLWLRPLPIPAQGAIVTVQRNTSVAQVTQELYRQGLVRYPKATTRLALWHGYKQRLRFGQYRLRSGLNAKEVFRQLSLGTNTVSHSLTLIPGWSLNRLMQQLAVNPNLEHTLTPDNRIQWAALLGIPHPTVDGLLYPDTYHFKWGNRDVTVLKQAYRKMLQVLTRAWQHRAQGLPYLTPYQALTAASLIQTEVKWDDEKPLVASVIVNRLRKGMRLQIDTTVLFAMNKPYGTRLLHRDLRFVSPYNTYRVKGLPPSPIAFPSLSSIQAALHPATSSYLYYVARGDGRHVFSSTYRAHLLGVSRYRRFVKRQKSSARYPKPLSEQDLMTAFMHWWSQTWHGLFYLLMQTARPTG